MDLPKIMTFHPTMEEFKNFSEFINKMESMGAHKAGLAKVIPPKEWMARKGDYKNVGNIVIPCPITQEIQGRGGVYEVFNMEPRNIKSGGMTVSEFEKKATSKEYATPLHCDADDLERRYWTNIAYNPPLYGADVSGSLYDQEQDVWNIGHLQTILDSTLGDEGGLKIEGVNTAYLYFGMWKSTFAWHTEDMDLYSINYLHFGAPKFWYTVPPKYGRRLERVAQMFFKNKADQCPGFLRHKCYLLSPTILRKFNVPFNKMIQEEGQFMITFPYAYHAGFNHGYNCAESTNFATERWIEYGKRCKRCYCIKEMVQIDMDSFVKKYQPEKYKAWINDEDIAPHPEDDEKRKVSRSVSLAGCTKKGGEQPSRRHPLSINFGSTPKRESSSKSIKRRIESTNEGGKKKFKQLQNKTLKTSLRSKLRKRSILVSCRKSMETRAQSLKMNLTSGKSEEKESTKPPMGVGRRFGGRKSTAEKQGLNADVKDPDKICTRSLLSSETAQEILSDYGNESDASPAVDEDVAPPSLVASTSCSVRGRRNFLRTNQKRRQCRTDFYTPLAERVKLRRASGSRSSKSPSNDCKAPQLERVEMTHANSEAPLIEIECLKALKPVDLVSVETALSDVPGKTNVSISRRSSRNQPAVVSVRRQPIRGRNSKSLDQTGSSGGGNSLHADALVASDPEEPQMPQLVPVSSSGDPRVLRSHHRDDYCRSGKDAPTLDCFK